MVRRNVSLLGLGSALLLTSVFSGSQAKADSIRFIYNGGHWSHSRHSGWHRYWGGPSIGFYYAPEPVYIVRGYDDPYYYEGPDYWYSNPSFGLSLDIGGGGYRRGYGDDYDRYHRGDRYGSGSGYYYGGNRYHDNGYNSYSGNSRYRNGSGYESGSRYHNGSSFNSGGSRYRNGSGYNSGSGQYRNGSGYNSGGYRNGSGYSSGGYRNGSGYSSGSGQYRNGSGSNRPNSGGSFGRRGGY